jgi:uncharacterized protein (DUF697 family)
MTSQLLLDDRGTAYHQTPEPNHHAAQVATAVILRATAVVLLLAVAVVHIVQLVPTFQATPALGAAFVALIAGAVLVGGWLVKERRTALHLWLPVAGFGIAALIGYGFTRVYSSPLDRVDVGNWSCELGMAALFLEGVLVAIALYAIALRPRIEPDHPSLSNNQENRFRANGHVNGTRPFEVGGPPKSA